VLVFPIPPVPLAKLAAPTVTHIPPLRGKIAVGQNRSGAKPQPTPCARIHNDGHLPENWTEADLFAPHTSKPHNPDIANGLPPIKFNVFYHLSVNNRI
jgi:hypothetical protein